MFGLEKRKEKHAFGLKKSKIQEKKKEKKVRNQDLDQEKSKFKDFLFSFTSESYSKIVSIFGVEARSIHHVYATAYNNKTK